MINRIDVRHTYIELSPYELGDNSNLEGILSTYDKITHSHVAPYAYFYDEDNKSLRITRGYNVHSLEAKFNIVANMKYDCDPYDKMRGVLKYQPRDLDQKRTISFILGKNDFSYTGAYSRLFVKNDTGTGKSYCVIASAINRGYKTAIIVHSKFLANQWRKYITEYTNIIDKEIYDVFGSDSIDKLFNKDKLVKINKFYILSYDTILSYADTHGWSSITELFKHIKIGFKVFDESHLRFDAIMKIDLNTNTKHTLYLTASAMRTDVSENRLYKLVFDKVPSIEITEDENYIDTIVCFFNSGGNINDEADLIINRRGLSQVKYMKYITEGKGKNAFNKTILRLLKNREHEISKDSQVIILVGTINACDIVKTIIEEVYPQYSIGIYNSSISNEDKENNLRKDIIVSTSKSLGTGSDIEGLFWIIMCESYSSEATAKQVRGRLRNRNSNKTYRYTEVLDTSIGPARRQYMQRKKFLNKKSKSFKEIIIK